MKVRVTYGVMLAMLIVSSEGSVPPRIATLVVPKTSAGEEAVLFCSLDSGTRPINFIWTKDGQEVTSYLVNSLQTSSNLVIPVVKPDDRGQYTCKAKSAVGEDEKSAYLVITGELSDCF